MQVKVTGQTWELVFSCCYPLASFETRSLIGLELTKQATLAGWWATEVQLPLLPQCWDSKSATTPHCFIWVLGLYPAPCDFQTSPLMTELSLQPSPIFLNLPKYPVFYICYEETHIVFFHNILVFLGLFHQSTPWNWINFPKRCNQTHLKCRANHLKISSMAEK